jgi:hypothetical protein
MTAAALNIKGGPAPFTKEICTVSVVFPLLCPTPVRLKKRINLLFITNYSCISFIKTKQCNTLQKRTALKWRIKINYEIILKGCENRICNFGMHKKVEITKSIYEYH